MARIICFTDSAAVFHAVQQGLDAGEHSLYPFPASRLTSELRHTVQSIAPEVIVLELSHATDNPHLYFFLRSDQSTRNIPIILISAGKRLAQQAEILGADGYVERPFVPEQLRTVIDMHISVHHAVAA